MTGDVHDHDRYGRAGGDDRPAGRKYQAEYAGLVQYYLLAQDVFLLGRLHWVIETSLLKTLAGKHRSTVNVMARKYKAPAGRLSNI
jgi:hypothetical protein